MRNVVRRAVMTVLGLSVVLPTLFPKVVSPLVVGGLVGSLSIAAVVAGVRMHRLGQRLVWHVGRPVAWALLGGGLAGLVVSHLLRATVAVGHLGVFPSTPEVPLLLAYPCMAAGLLILLEGRSPGEAAQSALSATITAFSVALPLWAFVLGPLAGRGHMHFATAVGGL